jgi:two-component system sensor histidine kinase HydH
VTRSNKILADSQDLSSLKPFRLVKFFSYTGLIVFLIFSFILVWLISNHTKKMLIERSEGYALVLANNLNHQVFLQFVIPAIRRYGKIAISHPEQFKRLDTIVKNTTHGMHVQAVTIFDRDEGIVSYSTIAEMVGQKDLGDDEYKKALQGENNSELTLSGSIINLLPGTDEIFCQLKTYIPFRQETGPGQSTGAIMGVFEIVQDLSGDFKALIRLQGVIIGTAVIIMSALFMALGLIVARADRIIAARAMERRKLEEKLNHAERLAGLGKMVASVSHEIKNPLGIVRSTAELLEKRLGKLAPGNEHLAKIIVDETGRLNGIVSEFLDFARPQNPEFMDVSINDILHKAVTFMAPELAKTKIKYEESFAERVKKVKADPDQLYRAFLNILVNAVHAMPDGGVLLVSTRPMPRRSGSSVLIEICDTGSGMSKETQDQIFTPFFTDKIRGTGLGLAIVKNIIDNHQGSIIVLSTEGEGTVFKIEL